MGDSTARRVADHLEEDIVLTEALRRGIVNQRALARWLMETHDWDTSEDSVVRGIRRHSPENRENVFEDARDVLAASHVNTRSELCSVQLTGRGSIEDQIPDLFEGVNTFQGEVVRVLSSSQGFKVIVDEANLDLIRKSLGERYIDEVKRGLTEVSVVLPPRGWETPGILSLLTSRMALREINIDGFVDGVEQISLLVDDQDAIEAYDTVLELVGNPDV